ncbi:hypothetical protein [Nocardia sp. XZ_19_385]|uniref:hypothetical protein n=1 Tax=Nocardia sp. XZ_19_385 TaxID=2769488 RepID=UPI00188F49A3|nr:hypothetical protein [Nocardia sp. XZ_19_385]
MRTGVAALVLCGGLVGPVAGGQLALLAKPFGGVVGTPGAAIGYLAVSAFVLGCLTAAIRATRSMRVAGACGVIAGLAFAVAGLVSTTWMFTAAVLIAGAAAGPVFATGRVLALSGSARLLTGWHVVIVLGVVIAAGVASICERTPGTGLLAVGLVGAACGAAAVSAREDSGGAWGKRRSAKGWSVLVPVRRAVLGYGALGLLVGGTVLPALHLLLFRWNAVGSEQTILLVFAALPAVVAVALPAPDSSAIVPLLILAAGGPVLVATAPGELTLVVGLAVSLAAAARAARGLDAEIHASAAPSESAATATVLIAAAAALAGLGLVSGVGRLAGTGSGLVVLAGVSLICALLCGRLALRVVTAEPIFQGGTQ